MAGISDMITLCRLPIGGRCELCGRNYHRQDNCWVVEYMAGSVELVGHYLPLI